MYSLFIYIYIHCKSYLSKYIYLGQITIVHLHPNFPETAPSISVAPPRPPVIETSYRGHHSPCSRSFGCKRENFKRMKFCKSARNFWGLDPWKLTWHWNMGIPMFNRKYILKWWMFHCHVSFLGVRFFCFKSFWAKKNVVTFTMLSLHKNLKNRRYAFNSFETTSTKGDLFGGVRRSERHVLFSHLSPSVATKKATATKMQNLMTFPWYSPEI